MVSHQDSSPGPLAPWREGVEVSAVSPEGNQHSIHTYFNAPPESPDGRWVLYFASTTPEGHAGEIHIVERGTGRVRVLGRDVVAEDGHRVACQQWASEGRRVVFHDLRDGEWVVVSVDVDTLEERVLAVGRQIAWGQPLSDIVPIYGPHWAPGVHRDSGKVRYATWKRAIAPGPQNESVDLGARQLHNVNTSSTSILARSSPAVNDIHTPSQASYSSDCPHSIKRPSTAASRGPSSYRIPAPRTRSRGS